MGWMYEYPIFPINQAPHTTRGNGLLVDVVGRCLCPLGGDPPAFLLPKERRELSSVLIIIRRLCWRFFPIQNCGGIPLLSNRR